MDNKNKVGILLESGTNEIEIMEFTIGGETFGINVAKVREIMMPQSVKNMPHSHEAIEGVFKPRDIVLTVVNLPKYLNLEDEEHMQRDLFIITSFNKIDIAFRVHTVEGIHRIYWENIQKPDKTIYGGQDGVATGIAKFDDRLITILDFEKIVADISPSTSIQMKEIDDLGERQENTANIVIAEDSVLLSKLIIEALNKAGFSNIMHFPNGKETYNYIVDLGKNNEVIKDVIDILITDIEMPEMDGHRLTKLIKDDPKLQSIPIIIFSSLIDDEMRRKGESLGANAQLSKPEIGKLVNTIDRLI